MAIEIGLSLHEFWLLTPKQFEKHIKVYTKKKREDMEEVDMLNWVLGKYIAYSFNEPKKYPKKPMLGTSANTTMSVEEMEDIAKRNCMKMGGDISAGG